jgi:hypothetical protein
MSLIADKGKGGVLPLDETTKKEMRSKHPAPVEAPPDSLLTGDPPPDTHSILFTGLDGELIRKCAQQASGSPGISQQEDKLWHRMVSSFKETSSNLCSAVAALARRICTQPVDPRGLEALLANRGVALDKNPGLRPIGLRRILGKTVMTVTIADVQRAVGSLQLCAGHPAGVEAAIHAMRAFLESNDNDGILLIDADNAFNRVNRQAALWNTQFTCPSMKYALINMYRAPSRIFMNGNSSHYELPSEEGTTQGCPLGMAMYALALAPMVKELKTLCNQVWYADDASGSDTFAKLRKWFDQLVRIGPKYGYFPKPIKCILLSKPDRVEEAKKWFKGTDVEVMANGCKDSGVELNCEGTRHLGAAVGTEDFKAKFVKAKVANWIKAVEKLAEVSQSQPHAAFAAFTHCLQSQWTFLARSMPRTSQLFQPLERMPFAGSCCMRC